MTQEQQDAAVEGPVTPNGEEKGDNPLRELRGELDGYALLLRVLYIHCSDDPDFQDRLGQALTRMTSTLDLRSMPYYARGLKESIQTVADVDWDKINPALADDTE